MKKFLISFLIAFAFVGVVSADSFTDKLQYGQHSNGLYYTGPAQTLVYCYDMSCQTNANSSDPKATLAPILRYMESMNQYFMPRSYWEDIAKMKDYIK